MEMDLIDGICLSVKEPASDYGNVMDYRLELLQKRFAIVNELFSFDELNELEAELDKIVSRLSLDASHIDINRPSKKSKFLLKSAVFKKCRLLAESFFQKRCYCLYDHAIYKFGFCNTPTLWHQDQAYLGANIPIKSLNFWIPLQDTDERNGGLLFAKDNPAYLMPHKKVLSFGTEQLVTNFDSEYCCELVKRGSVSIHDNLALHASSINLTNSIRKAWIIHFSPTAPLVKRIYQIKSQFYNF